MRAVVNVTKERKVKWKMVLALLKSSVECWVVRKAKTRLATATIRGYIAGDAIRENDSA
jgi:hypothetical protein